MSFHQQLFSVILPNDFDFNHVQRIINLFIEVVVVVIGVVSAVVVVGVVAESAVVVVVGVVVVVVVGVIVVVDETASTRSFIIIPRTLNQPFH